MIDIVGEAGVGKSRLVYEFQKRSEGEVMFLTGNCVQYGRNINFLPVIDIVKGAFDIQEGLTEAEVGHQIEEKAPQNLAEMIPFYLSLLSLKVEDPKFKALESEERKFGTFEAVKDLLIFLSGRKPLVVCLEDVHWIDKISEALFTYFARSIADRPVLMLSVYRPEGSPSWAQGTHYQRLGIETLSSKSSAKLIRNVLHVPALEPKLEEKILEKTAGNPLFIEEIVRELLDRGDLVKSGDQYICKLSIDQCEIPNTVHGVLAARMDRLSEDLKRTMQVASVIGRDFAFRLLKTIMELGEELRAQMTNLVGLEILYEKALYPELEYIFKHTLIHEVAYDSLLKQKRREIHGRIAQAIEELYSERLEEHYESLAHHYELAGDAGKAVKYLILAGEKSNQIGAAQVACEFLEKAQKISEKANLALHAEMEVRLLFELATAQIGIGAWGFGVKGLRRAIELSRRHGMVDYEGESLQYLGLSMVWWPELEEAERTIDECIARARELDDKGLESIMLSYKAQRTASYNQRNRLSHMILEAESAALASKKPRFINFAHFWRSVFERWLGNPRKAVELSEGIFEAILKSSSISQISGITFQRGLALAEMGRIEDGIAIIRNGIDVCEKFGAHVFLGSLYNTLGYCYSEIYQIDQAKKYNLKSEEIARRLFVKYPMSRGQLAHVLGQADTSLVENLLDEGNVDAAWERIKAFQKEAKSEDFFYNRYQWESRMNYLAAQVLLLRNDIDQAETIIQENLKKVRKDLMKKREGSFLRVLGEVQIRRNENENAITTLNESIQILKEVENPRQLWQAHASLASAFTKIGRHSEAKEQWGVTAAIIQNTADGLSDRDLRESFLKADPVRQIFSKAER